MQFSAVPLNLINRKAANKASFVLTGNWAVKASKEAARYGTSINLPVAKTETSVTSRTTTWITGSRQLVPAHHEQQHLIRNTLAQLSRNRRCTLVADMTSEFLSRKLTSTNSA